MIYTTSRIEDYVHQIYRKLGVKQPIDIDMFSIAHALNIWVHYWEKPSTWYQREGMCSILLNQYDTPEKQWQDFAHELGHELQHVGNQLTLPSHFVQLQEWQADNFMMHFCIPTFMIEQMELPFSKTKAAFLVAEAFHVETGFAIRRLNMYERKIIEKYKRMGGY